MTRENLVKMLAAVLSIFILYTCGFGKFEILIQRSVFAALLICLTLAMFPLFRETRFARLGRAIDGALALACVAACIKIAINHGFIMDELPEAGYWDIFLAIVLVLTVLDLCRRSVGWSFTGIVLIVMAYALWGHFVPGQLGHKYMSLNFWVETLFLSDLGVWGSMTGLAASIVSVFIIFGSMLLFTGGGKTFIDLAALVSGKSPGGAAKIAVTASAIFGMMCGNSVGNVATTGSVTIPLMKRLGYPPALAGAVESVASTGGQMMPPIMSAVAFIIAEALGITYWDVAVASAIPAVLYFAGIYIGIHSIAIRTSLASVTEEEMSAIRRGFSWIKLLPFGGGIGGLGYGVIQGRSIEFSVFMGIVVMLVIHMGFQIRSGADFRKMAMAFVDALSEAGRGLVMVGILLLGAQILISLVNTTGIAATLSSIIVDLAGSSLFLLVVITATVSLILGMGLPTMASYILVAALLVPGMIKAGVVPLAAHLFVLYYACLSAITPPVCAAVFVAAGIAQYDWMAIAKRAMHLGIVVYMLPIFFVYYPGLLLIGSKGDVVFATLGGILLTYGSAYLVGRQPITGRPVWDFLIAMSLVIVAYTPNIYVVGSGFMVLMVLNVLVIRKRNRAILETGAALPKTA